MTKRPRKKYSQNPHSKKSPKIVQNPDLYEDVQFKWRVNNKYIDYDDEEWGWGKVLINSFFDKCLTFLQHYEDMSWARMKEEQHCHPVALKDITKRAQNRIFKLFGDIDDLYQVKAEGKCRLFGRKDRQIFYLIWHDENHTVYPGGN
jgi:hypothetical protein